MRFLERFRSNYRLPKEFAHKIHEENRKTFRVMYTLMFCFGVICLIIECLRTKVDIGNRIYYASFILVGIIGYLLSTLKTWKYSPLVCMFVFFESVFCFYFCTATLSASCIFYTGFLMILILLLNINPLFLAINLVVFHLVLTACVLLGFYISEDIIQIDFVFNSLLILAGLVILGFWKRRYTIKECMTEQKLMEEKNKSENLLLNILPQKVMEQLRDTGHSDPTFYQNTTVLFTDIVNFTEASSELSAEVLIQELNEIFTAFDKIIEKHQCTRIKTIGDAYMAVCGLPDPDELHAEKLLLCAGEFVEYLEKRNETSQIKWKIRVGLHSGQVVAGIVGIKKYIYDVFGDAVNVASRMENISEEMKITVSDATFNLVKDKFNFTRRDPIEVKGKGIMTTYFLDRKKN